MNRKIDYRAMQTALVYIWQEQVMDLVDRTHSNDLTIEECQALADEACAYVNIKPIKVVDFHWIINGEKIPSPWYTQGVVGLPEGWRQLPLLLHEIAHAVTDPWGRSNRHESDFVRCYIKLLTHWWIRQEWVLEATACDCGILGRE